MVPGVTRPGDKSRHEGEEKGVLGRARARVLGKGPLPPRVGAGRRAGAGLRLPTSSAQLPPSSHLPEGRRRVTGTPWSRVCGSPPGPAEPQGRHLPPPLSGPGRWALWRSSERQGQALHPLDLYLLLPSQLPRFLVQPLGLCLHHGPLAYVGGTGPAPFSLEKGWRG